jgi:hypothetical protein
MFSTGLGEALRIDVELVTPSDLQTTMTLSRAYERRLATTANDLEPITSTESKTTTSSAVLALAASTTPWLRI